MAPTAAPSPPPTARRVIAEGFEPPRAGGDDARAPANRRRSTFLRLVRRPRADADAARFLESARTLGDVPVAADSRTDRSPWARWGRRGERVRIRVRFVRVRRVRARRVGDDSSTVVIAANRRGGSRSSLEFFREVSEGRRLGRRRRARSGGEPRGSRGHARFLRDGTSLHEVHPSFRRRSASLRRFRASLRRLCASQRVRQRAFRGRSASFRSLRARLRRRAIVRLRVERRSIRFRSFRSIRPGAKRGTAARGSTRRGGGRHRRTIVEGAARTIVEGAARTIVEGAARTIAATPCGDCGGRVRLRRRSRRAGRPPRIRTPRDRSAARRGIEVHLRARCGPPRRVAWRAPWAGDGRGGRRRPRVRRRREGRRRVGPWRRRGRGRRAGRVGARVRPS